MASDKDFNQDQSRHDEITTKFAGKPVDVLTTDGPETATEGGLNDKNHDSSKKQ